MWEDSDFTLEGGQLFFCKLTPFHKRTMLSPLKSTAEEETKDMRGAMYLSLWGIDPSFIVLIEKTETMYAPNI